MRKEVAFVATILIVGYSLYGVVAVSLAAGTGTGIGAQLDDHIPGIGTDEPEKADSSVAFSFRNVSERTGFEYEYERKFTSNQQMVGNAGVFAADYNDDGWTDILAVGSGNPALFENRGGEFTKTGAIPTVNYTVRSAMFFDYDGNGDQELLFLPIDHTPVLLDWTDGQYEVIDAGFERALDEPIGATTADYNDDGCADLFVIQYGNWSTSLPEGLAGYNADFNGDTGNPNQLYYGNCSSFERATDAGFHGNRWSLATSTADFDDDGDMDIHVANDFNYDAVYLNRGNGTFVQHQLSERTNRNGMSSELSDVNSDGRLDIFVTNIFYPDYIAAQLSDVLKVKANGNNLMINQGGGEFKERAKQLGVYEGGWGWAAVMTDFDNDGDEDLFHTTRRMDWNTRSMELTERERYRVSQLWFYSYPVMWEYDDGRFYSVPTQTAGFEAANGRGTARLDYDRDGAMDIVVASTGTFHLYENTGATGNAVQIRVQDKSGARAIGARVYLQNGTTNSEQWRSVRPFTDFLAQDAGVVHFGVGDAETVTLRVVWPDGTERTFEDVRAGRRIVVRPSGIVETVSIAPRNATTVE